MTPSDVPARRRRGPALIALARFQLAGYLRSLRFMQPLIPVLLIVVLVLKEWSNDPRHVDAATGSLGDAAVLTFLIGAWAARSLLDTQPDEQRALSITAAGHPVLSAAAGLLAAYTVALCLGLLLLAAPLLQCLSVGVPPTPMLAGVGLTALVAFSGTALGALTQRAIIPSPGYALPALLCGVTAALLLSLGPLAPLSVPMTGWLRAAHDGPSAFVQAFPGLALHLILWNTALTAVLFFLTRRPR